MNQMFQIPVLPAATRAAEGLPRRRWTVAEIEAMVRAGILPEHERVELIGGELVPMNAKGIRHEVIKNSLVTFLVRALPPAYRLAVETTFRIDRYNFIEPDFIFFRRADGLANLNPATALWAIEVADTSLVYDLGRKARIYAGFGVQELWVIEANSLLAHVHRMPREGSYQQVFKVDDTTAVSPLFAPELVVTMSEVELF